MMELGRILVSVGLLIVLVASFEAPAAVNLTQLGGSSDVGDEENAPYAPVTDGETVVYIANDDIATQPELYAVRFDMPGAPIKLSGNLSVGEEVTAFQVSEDGQFVVYTVGSGTPPLSATEQLYSARVDGVGMPEVLTNAIPIPALGGGLVWQISPTSDRVVYLVNDIDLMTFQTTARLFSVPIEGGANVPLTDEVSQISFQLSRDGSRVATIESVTSLIEEPDVELVSQPIAGGGPRRVISETDETPYQMEFTFDSARLVYAALRDDFTTVLKSKTTLGANSVTVENFGALASQDPAVVLFRPTPDSQRVVYAARAAALTELKSSPITNPDPRVIDSGADLIFLFQISNDSQFVVYSKSVALLDGANNLLSARLPSGAPVTLNTGLAANSFYIGFPTFDSSRVVFSRSDVSPTGIDEDGAAELFSTAIDGSGSPTTLNAPLAPGGHIKFFFPFFDSTKVLYLADQDVDEEFEIFEVAIGGGVVNQLNDPLALGGDVLDGIPTIDSSKVVYRADQDADDVIDVFVAVTEGGGPIIFADGFEGP